MKTQNTLDPPSGDYVKYIENLQKGKIKPSEGLQVPSGSIKPARDINPPPQPQPQKNSRRGNTNPLLAAAFGPFLLLVGVASIVTGVSIGPEPLIPIGMFTLFFGFIITSRTHG